MRGYAQDVSECTEKHTGVRCAESLLTDIISKHDWMITYAKTVSKQETHWNLNRKREWFEEE